MVNVRYFNYVTCLSVFVVTYFKYASRFLVSNQQKTSQYLPLFEDGDSATSESDDSDVLKFGTVSLSNNASPEFMDVEPMSLCSGLIEGDPDTVEMAKSINKTRPVIEDHEFVELTKDCGLFIDKMGYITESSEEERNFPLAYTMLVHKEVARVERLLRAIYRPQNIYCIHVDLDANMTFHEGVSALAGCFDNVFVPEGLVDVVWGKYSLLEAEHVCLRELLAHSNNWRYYMNLAVEEFPLKTNLELVRILRTLNGSNVVQATQRHNLYYRWDSQLPAPYNVTVIKGQWHVAVTRRFVKYLLTDPRSLALQAWVRGTRVPDETLVPTLNHNPVLQAPGSYTGWPQSDKKYYIYIGRHVIWQRKNRKPCRSGYFVRNVCILGVDELTSLVDRKELFLNKFRSDFQPLALDCMEELLYNRSRQDITGVNRLNLTFYSSLPQVKHHIP